jgi:hypothetical protein
MTNASRSLAVALLTVLCATSAGAVEAPIAVSPGHSTHLAQVEGRCPTFNWGAVAGARSYQLTAYRLGEEGKEAKPVLREIFAGSVSGWTPALDQCLERGRRYAWTVRAVGERETSDWSAPALFQVAAGPTRREFEAALAKVQQYLAVQQASVAAAPEPAEAGAEHPDLEQDTLYAGLLATRLIPEAPETVSLVTEGAVGVGTSTPLADLHILGDSTTAGVLVGTSERGASELLLASDPIGDFGMKLRWDGTPGVGDFQIWGRTTGVDAGPWLSIDRATGAAVFGGTITGDGSGLVSVNAETVDGMDSTAFSTGAHTSDSTCLDPGVICNFAASTSEGGAAISGDSASGFFATGRIEKERIDDALTTDAELRVQVASLKRCAVEGWRYSDTGDGTVLDCNTGKMWLKDAGCLGDGWWDPSAGPGSLQGTIADLNDVETGSDFGCADYVEGSYTDWRAPTLWELCSAGEVFGICPGDSGADSLVGSWVSGSPKVVDGRGNAGWAVDGDAFVGVQPVVYWSATDWGSQYGWVTLLDNGSVFPSERQMADVHAIWPVRTHWQQDGLSHADTADAHREHSSLEESAEIDSDIAAHDASVLAHPTLEESAEIVAHNDSSLAHPTMEDRIGYQIHQHQQQPYEHHIPPQGIQGYEIVTEADLGPDAVKVLSATCPYPKKVLGGGYSFEYGLPKCICVQDSRPVDVVSWLVTGAVCGDFCGAGLNDWTLKVWAVCGKAEP